MTFNVKPQSHHSYIVCNVWHSSDAWSAVQHQFARLCGFVCLLHVLFCTNLCTSIHVIDGTILHGTTDLTQIGHRLLNLASIHDLVQTGKDIIQLVDDGASDY
jgi:hypothetical protein